MEKITMVNINNKDYKLTESAYSLLSDYNKYIKRTIREKEKILDLEIQISVIIDMEIENKGEDPVVDIEDIKEVIKVLKESEKIYNQPGRHKAKNMHEKRQRKNKRESDLKRDTKAGVLGGVCAGIANRFNIDPVLARVIFIVLTLIFGIFFFVYILLWIVLPEDK